jgi:hypothetical protein
MGRMIRGWVLSLVVATSLVAQSPALRIVVLDGEDAVNIIQQKTAVAPLVEVRDRNNLPVPGVAVTFTVGGQGATFGGASTLTVTTNAAGQAAAVGLTPTAAGAVQINAAAVFQGQTAVATITQTNVLTAAQAAAQTAGATAGGSAGGSTTGTAGGAAAGGGGGGLSATTIGIVGAAVGGGALVATQVGGSNEPTPTDNRRTYSGDFSGILVMTFPGPPSCSRPETYTGTLKIKLDPGQIGVVSGTATLEARMVVGTTNCPNGPQAGTGGAFAMPETPVSGSAGAVGFTGRQVVTTPASGNDRGGMSTNELIFNGTMSSDGSTITGTLAHSLRIETPGFVPGTGSTTYAVTLR